MDDIIKWCKENNKELWEYVEHCEGKEIWVIGKPVQVIPQYSNLFHPIR